MVSSGKTAYVSARDAVKKDSSERRAERIRGLLRTHGAMAPIALSKKCDAEGIFTDADTKLFALSTKLRIIRDALSKADVVGLPFAGPTVTDDSDGHAEWAQRTLWQFDDYELNVNERLRQRDGEHIAAVKLADECLERHGRRPKVSNPPTLKSIRLS